MSRDLKKGISVVVPVYNGSESLPELTDRLARVLEGKQGGFELLLVDDGSSDGSWEVIEKLSNERDWVRGFSLMRNYGQHNALLCGIRCRTPPRRSLVFSRRSHLVLMSYTAPPGKRSIHSGEL